MKFITLTPIIVERDREVVTMRRFKQLSRADRLKIEALLKAGHGKQEIADLIGVHVSTRYRELQRGRYPHTNSDLTIEDRYSPDIETRVQTLR